MSFSEWMTREQRLLGYIALGAVIVGNSLGNIFFKLGANSGVSGPPLLALLRWQTVLGMACFASAAIAYAWALRQFDLHSAQIVISLQYVSVILLSVFFFGEKMTTNECIGIVLIALGLFACSR
ncbi:MAG TPA: EamA family transporter [Rudaea sp.]